MDFRHLVGNEIGRSRWWSIDQQRIDSFADVTEDWQGIHVDAAKAGDLPFGSTIAHGFLVLSLLSAMLQDALPPFEDRLFLINYGFDKVRFVSPVRAGCRVRGKINLLASSLREPGSYLNKFSVVVEVENQPKPGLVAEWLTLEQTSEA